MYVCVLVVYTVVVSARSRYLRVMMWLCRCDDVANGLTSNTNREEIDVVFCNDTS